VSAAAASLETLFAPCDFFLHLVFPTSVTKIIYLDSVPCYYLTLPTCGRKWMIGTQMTTLSSPPWPPKRKGRRNNSASIMTRASTFPTINNPDERMESIRGCCCSTSNSYDKILVTTNSTITKKYNKALTFYDQDLLNIYFLAHPNRLQLLSCGWNFRTDHYYVEQQRCDGIQLLHGNRGVFHRDSVTNYPVLAFQIVYESFASLPTRSLMTYGDVQEQLHQQIQATEGMQSDNQCEIVVLSVALYQLAEACLASQDRSSNEL
jgi:hypothetical protein